MPRRKFAWEKLSDEQLLKRRLSSLRVGVEGTWLESCLNTLYEELEERGIRLRPHAWISSEWFSPAHVPGIAIPFYLAHPRLKKLEYVDELMGEIAGKRAPVTTREKLDPLRELSQTLGEHYEKKQAFYAFTPPKTYDRDLSRLFSADPRHRRSQPASTFIRRH